MRSSLLLPVAIISMLGCSRSSSPSPQDAAAPASPSSAVAANPAGGPCGEADALLAQAESSATEGRLAKAVRRVDRANEVCPQSRARSLARQLGWLSELGDADRVKSLAAELQGSASATQADRDAAQKALREVEANAPPAAVSDDARKDAGAKMAAGHKAFAEGRLAEARSSFLEAWKTAADPIALVRAGLAAREQGDAALAHKLFDRASIAASKSAGALVVEQQHAMLGPTRAAWSRDGAILALAHGAAISILDGQTFVERTPLLRGHTQKINSLAVSPDGRTLASAAADGTIRLWDTATGKAGRKLEANWNTVHAVAFSPNGKLLASDTNHLVRLWDPNTARVQETIKGHKDGVNAIAFRPDGVLMAAGAYDNTIGLWDIRSGGFVRKLYREGLPGSTIAFSPDGKLLAANTARKILLWDVESGEVAKELGDREWGDYLAFHPAGKLLASAATGAAAAAAPSASPAGSASPGAAAPRVVKLWDIESGKVVRELKGHTADPTNIVFDGDGTLVGAGSEDRTLVLWDTSSGRVVHTLQRDRQKVTAGAVSADGKSIALSAGDDSVMSWDLSRGKPAWTARANASAICHRSDGAVVAGSGKDLSLRVIDATGKVVSELPKSATTPPGSIACSPDRKRAALGAADGTISVIELDAGKVVAKLQDSERTQALAFSSDGKLLAVGPGYKNLAVRVWDLETGKVVQKLPGHKDHGTAIAFSPDGTKLASGAEDHTVQLWTRWGKPRALGHGLAAVTSLAFSPDGSALVTGADDSVVRVWDVAGTAGVRELTGHEAAVRWVGFVAEGKVVVGGGDDGTIRFWALSDARPLATIRLAGADAWYVLAQGDGKGPGRAAIGGANGAIAATYPSCRYGSLVLPFEACRDQVEAEGFLGPALRGEPLP